MATLFDIVVFGGTGDLARRKLLPALYHHDAGGELAPGVRIFATARGALTRSDYLDLVERQVRPALEGRHFDAPAWVRFRERLDYVVTDAAGGRGLDKLKAKLDGADGRARVFYLATSPELFGPICHHLAAADLVTPEARVVLEKPIGHDLASSREINEAVGAVFPEDRIFRIDHYLGKEAVQNLLALRFANAFFEPIWHRGGIDHVQITVAEKIGVEGRGDYYDGAGALRDMVQNHLLQLLCLVAMEPPTSLDKDTVRAEKVKVLSALRPMSGQEVAQRTVRGQYRAGAVDGTAVPGYLDEISGKDSTTETFVALRAEIDNWRWAGVPFFLRTGKRMADRVSEIVIQLRPVPHRIFPEEAGEIVQNRLVIRLQPDEGVKLLAMAKVPGSRIQLRPAPLNLSFAETFQGRSPDAYERLLLDVARGNPTLFMRRDEVERAWEFTEPILAAWAHMKHGPKGYVAGSWGPSSAVALIERDGRTWHEDMR
jgi:glucose-6-phosphate 1-dehydrogenase